MRQMELDRVRRFTVIVVIELPYRIRVINACNRVINLNSRATPAPNKPLV
jgi:hypothetical protein